MRRDGSVPKLQRHGKRIGESRDDDRDGGRQGVSPVETTTEDVIDRVDTKMSKYVLNTDTQGEGHVRPSRPNDSPERRSQKYGSVSSTPCPFESQCLFIIHKPNKLEKCYSFDVIKKKPSHKVVTSYSRCGFIERYRVSPPVSYR